MMFGWRQRCSTAVSRSADARRDRLMATSWPLPLSVAFHTSQNDPRSTAESSASAKRSRNRTGIVKPSASGSLEGAPPSCSARAVGALSHGFLLLPSAGDIARSPLSSEEELELHTELLVDLRHECGMGE